MHIVNFAYGEIYMLGGFAMYYLVTRLGINYFLSLPIAMGMLFMLGIVLEKIVFSRIRGRFMDCLLVTLGLSLIIISWLDFFWDRRCIYPISRFRRIQICWHIHAKAEIAGCSYWPFFSRPPILTDLQKQDR